MLGKTRLGLLVALHPGAAGMRNRPNVDFCGYWQHAQVLQSFFPSTPVVEVALLQIRSAPSASQAGYRTLCGTQEKDCRRIARCRRGKFRGLGHRRSI
jgi:hypothetical protein